MNLISASTARRRTEFDVEKVVAQETNRGNLNIADTKLFLRRFFPVLETDINAIYNILIADGFEEYDGKAMRWRDRPQSRGDLSEGPESSMYSSFVNTANTIVRAANIVRLSKTDGTKRASHNAIWVNTHSIAPKSQDEDLALIRPDGVLWLITKDECETWEKFIKEEVANDNATLEKKGGRQKKNEKQKLVEKETAGNSPGVGKGEKQKKSEKQKLVEEETARSPAVKGKKSERQKKQKVVEETTRNGPTVVRLPSWSFDILDKEKKDERHQKSGKQKLVEKTAKDDFTMEWWKRTYAVIEMQPEDNDESQTTLYRLFSHMHEQNKNQPDRLYTTGFVVGPGKLSVWMSDRTGILGTSKPFDIDQHPKDLIRVISAFHLLAPTTMGWDPNMQLCKVPLTQHIETYHSFDPHITLNDYKGLDSYSNHWAIEVPCPSENDPNKTETFVTIRALSPIGSQNMTGTATLVWAAVRAGDLRTTAKPYEVFVVKQSWRPVTSTPECKFYQQAKKEGAIVVEVAACGDMKGLGGKTIDTRHYIRQDVVCYEQQEAQGNAFDWQTHLDKQADKESYCASFDIGSFIESATPLTWRIQTRIALGVYGWPIHLFRDLNEFVKVLLDLVKCHEELHAAGILHQDISIDNCLICLKDRTLTSPVTMEGKLIHFDCAKMTSSRIKSWLKQYEQRVDNYTQGCTAIYEAQNHATIPPALMALIQSVGYHPSSYFRELYELFPELKGKETLTAEDLGLGGSDMLNFQDHLCDNAQRSVFSPFASAEVLNPQYPIFPSMQPPYIVDGKNASEEAQGEPSGIPSPAPESPVISTMLSRIIPGDEESSIKPSTTFAPQQQQLRCGDSKLVVHRTTHDMEALFWLITMLCMTHSGPGELRSDPDSAGPDGLPSRQIMIKNLFASHDIYLMDRTRRRLFFRDEYEQKALCHIHPYFNPFKPILLRWWRILRFAYQVPAFEATHEHFKKVLQQNISPIEQHVLNNPHPGTEKIDEYRKKDMESLQNVRVTDENSDNTEQEHASPVRSSLAGPSPMRTRLAAKRERPGSDGNAVVETRMAGGKTMRLTRASQRAGLFPPTELRPTKRPKTRNG